MDQKKGVYIDGHERDDVIEYCQKFLGKMVSIGFLNKDNAPTSEAAQFLPDDLECPSSHQLERTVVFFHDESIFTANEDQKLQEKVSDILSNAKRHCGEADVVFQHSSVTNFQSTKAFTSSHLSLEYASSSSAPIFNISNCSSVSINYSK